MRKGVRAFTRSPLAVVYLTVFLDILGFGIVIPLLPLYARRFQASAVEIGLLMSCYSAAQMICAPLWGHLSDRIGRRPVMLVSLFGSIVSYTIFASSNTLGLLLFGRSLAGVCAANISSAQAYVADVTDEAGRTRGMGMLGAAFGLGFVLGPALGGLTVRWGHRAPFVLAALLCAFDFILALAWLVESPRKRDRARPSIRAAFALVKGRRELGLLMLLVGFVVFAFANLESMFTLFLHARFGFEEHGVAGMFVLIGAMVVLVQGGLIGRLARRFPERSLIATGTFLLGLGLLLLPQARTLTVLIVAVVLFSLGNGVNHPSLFSLISREAGRENQGAVLGIAQAISSLGRILGPIFGGFVFDRIGQGAPYYAGGALMLVACGISFLLRRPAEPTT